MSSKGTPALDIRETKLRRSSRGRPLAGVQASLLRHGAQGPSDVGRVHPATECCAEHEVVVDPSVACAIPRLLLGLLMSGQGLDTQVEEAERSPREAGLRVTALADRSPQLDRWWGRRVVVWSTSEVHVCPSQCTQFFGSRTGQ